MSAIPWKEFGRILGDIRSSYDGSLLDVGQVRLFLRCVFRATFERLMSAILR